MFPNFTKRYWNHSPAWFKCAGRIVVDSTSEKTKIGIAVKGNVLHIGPVSPAKSSIGAKTTIVVKIPKKTGSITSIVPFTVEVKLSSLSLILLRNTFSPTIIASSTTIPSTTINIKVDKTFIVTPNSGSNNNAPPKDMGIPMATQKATEGLKNIVKRISTKHIPIAKFLYRIFILSSRNLAWSYQ